MDSGTYSIRETARRLGIGDAMAYRLAHADALPVPVLRIGSLMRTRVAEVETFLRSDLLSHIPPTTKGNHEPEALHEAQPRKVAVPEAPRGSRDR